MDGPARAPAQGPHDWSDKVAHVLQLVIEQCPDVSEATTLCGLLLANKTCRRTVQLSAGHLEIYCCDIDTTTAIASLAAWLPHHAGLVKHLSVHCPLDSEDAAVHGCMLTMALQLSAHAPAIAAASAGPAAEELPLSLQLRRFTTDYLVSPTVISSLAVSSQLTSLNIERLSTKQATTAFCTALAQLHSVKALCCYMQPSDVCPRSLAAALCKLPSLTELTIRPVSPATLPCLPQQLQVLNVNVEASPQAAGAVSCLDLRQISGLKELKLTAVNIEHGQNTSMPLMLPRQLTSVIVNGPVSSLNGCPELQQLEQFVADSSVLRALWSAADMPKLHTLTIRLQNVNHYAARDFQEAIVAIGHIGSLTNLQVHNHVFNPNSGLMATLSNVGWCGSLQPLKNLRHLKLTRMHLKQEDALALTSLTTLEALGLCGCGPGVDDMVAVALACQLTKLQWLELAECGLRSTSLFPVLPSLTALTYLGLGANPMDISDTGLRLLSRCTHLTVLSLPDSALDSCTPEGYSMLRMLFDTSLSRNDHMARLIEWGMACHHLVSCLVTTG